MDQVATPRNTVQIGRNAERIISWEPRAVYWDMAVDPVAFGRAIGVTDEDRSTYKSYWSGFDHEGKLEGRLSRSDINSLKDLNFKSAFEAFQARVNVLQAIISSIKDRGTNSPFIDPWKFEGWLLNAYIAAALRAKQRLESEHELTPELRAKWDELYQRLRAFGMAQLKKSEFYNGIATGLYYADIALIGIGLGAALSLFAIWAGPLMAAVISAAGSVGGAVITAGGKIAAATIDAASSTANTAVKALGGTLGSIGNTNLQYMPAGLVTAYENKNIPNVIELAFADAERPRSEFLEHRARVRDAANRAFKLIKAHRAGSPSAIASFGNLSILQSDRIGTHDLNEDAMLKAKLADYAAFEDVFDIEPGSHEAYMLADMFDLEAYKDPHTHYFLKKLWKGIKKVGKKLLPLAAFIPGVGTAIAGLGSGLIGGAVSVATKLGLGNLAQAAGAVAETVWQQKVQEGVAGTQRAIQEGASEQTIGQPLGAFTVAPGGRMIVHPVSTDPTLAARANAILTNFLLNAELVDKPKGFSTKLRPPAVSYGGVSGTPAGVFTMAPNGGINVLPTVGSQLPGAQQRAQQLLAEFTANRGMQGGAFTVNGFQGVANLVTYADNAVVGLGSTRSPSQVAFLSNKPAFLDGQTSDNVPCGHLFDRPGTPLPRGEFYRSGMLVARLSDLPSGVYGQIRVGELPYTIDINRNSVDSRAKVSFVHETLHGITELLKLGLSHDQLHALSVFITSEVLPGYLALSNKTK